MKNLKIRARLGIGFGLVIALMIGIAFTGISRLNTGSAMMQTIVSELYVKAAVSNQIKSGMNTVARHLRNAMLATGPEDSKKFLALMMEANKGTSDSFAKMEQLINTQEDRDLFKTMVDTRAIYGQGRDNVVKLLNEGNKEEAARFLTEKVIPLHGNYIAAIDKMVEHQASLVAGNGKIAIDDAKSATIQMAVLSVIAVVLAIITGALIARSITLPIGNAVELAEAVAQGDLTHDIKVDSKDETGRLLQALKNMNTSLQKIVGEVRSGTDTITAASTQITTGNLDLSSRTEQQASSLEETASSMEELTSTVKQNSDSARQANQLAISASEVAIKGGSVVSQVVDTMGSINESSRKIVDIIGVIDGIAFQTNILALNAAVEAARAGEQGRGFAVVASEVRNLAQRSAAAAKEIKTLIGDSVEKVEVGSKLVDQAGTTMNEVVESIKRVTDIMSEITAASHEQASGIEQINQAITQMDDATQQNAALVEEAAAAAQSLQDQANNLSKVVSVFRLDGKHESAIPTNSVGPASSARPLGKAHPVRLAANQAGAAKRAVNAKSTSGDDWETF